MAAHDLKIPTVSQFDARTNNSRNRRRTMRPSTQWHAYVIGTAVPSYLPPVIDMGGTAQVDHIHTADLNNDDSNT